MKLKCKCGKIATWCYMPAEEWACCDDCVPRGCTCWHNPIQLDDEEGIIDNYPEGIEGKDWEWIDKNKYWRELDGEGRQLPCCEWWYDEKGWDKDE